MGELPRLTGDGSVRFANRDALVAGWDEGPGRGLLVVQSSVPLAPLQVLTIRLEADGMGAMALQVEVIRPDPAQTVLRLLAGPQALPAHNPFAPQAAVLSTASNPFAATAAVVAPAFNPFATSAPAPTPEPTSSVAPIVGGDFGLRAGSLPVSTPGQEDDGDVMPPPPSITSTAPPLRVVMDEDDGDTMPPPIAARPPAPHDAPEPPKLAVTMAVDAPEPPTAAPVIALDAPDAPEPAVAIALDPPGAPEPPTPAVVIALDPPAAPEPQQPAVVIALDPPAAPEPQQPAVVIAPDAPELPKPAVVIAPDAPELPKPAVAIALDAPEPPKPAIARDAPAPPRPAAVIVLDAPEPPKPAAAPSVPGLAVMTPAVTPTTRPTAAPLPSATATQNIDATPLRTALPPYFSGDCLRFAGEEDLRAARGDMLTVGALLAVSEAAAPATVIEVRMAAGSTETRGRLKVTVSQAQKGTVVVMAVRRDDWRPLLDELEAALRAPPAGPTVAPPQPAATTAPSGGVPLQFPLKGNITNPLTVQGILAMPLHRSVSEQDLKTPSVPLLLRWLRTTRGVFKLDLVADGQPAHTCVLVDGREVRSPVSLATLGKSMSANRYTYELTELRRSPTMSHTGRSLHLIIEVVRGLLAQHEPDEVAAVFPHTKDPRTVRAVGTVGDALGFSGAHGRLVKSHLQGDETIAGVTGSAAGARTAWDVLVALELFGGLTFNQDA